MKVKEAQPPKEGATGELKLPPLDSAVNEALGGGPVPPPPPAVPEIDAPPPHVRMSSAVAVLADPHLRADPVSRAQASITFMKAWNSRGKNSDLGAAGYLFLSSNEKEWGLVQDVVEVKGPGFDKTFRGNLVESKDGKTSRIIMGPNEEARLRKGSGGSTYVRPPRNPEFKAIKITYTRNVATPPMVALNQFLKGLDSIHVDSASEDNLAQAATFLAQKITELRTKDPDAPVDGLEMFVAGLASSAIAANGGKANKQFEAPFKSLGYRKSEYGSVWGTTAGLAMDDFRKWLESGDYGMAVVQFDKDYKKSNDFTIRYARALLVLLKAVRDNRFYYRAASNLELISRRAGSKAAREHVLALAKSIRVKSPCAACWGTHKINCSACKGKAKVTLQCGTCGGSGKQVRIRGGGVRICPGCRGKGIFRDVKCPKCKASGKATCRARYCRGEVPRPSLETFTDAYKCGFCQGLGSVLKHVAYSCPQCNGVGMVLRPKFASDKTLH